MPYPLVTVCTSGAAYTPLPCTPKASIYSDAALSVPLANPFRGDMFGNIEFYATPAAYVVSVTAPYSPGYSFKMSASGGFAGTIASTQVAFGSALNAIAGDANFTWNNTAKSLTVTNTGLSGIAPIYALASGVTGNEAGLVAQCQQLGNFFCEAGQFVASDSGAGPIGSVIGIASVPGHTAAGTLATMTGVDVTPSVGNGAGAITTSRGIHVGGIAFLTGTSPVTHDGIIVDDQCSGSFPATNCTGIRVAAQSNGKPGVTAGNINGILYVGTGYYASLQAAHDALPAAGGTVFVTATGTPFGAAGTTALAITKSGTYQFDCAVYTYSGSAAQAISIASANGVTIQGCGNANGQPSGATASRGTQIVVTNTAANGIDANGDPGLILRNFTLLGPNSGTGKGIILTANSGHLIDLNVRAWGGNGVEIDGTRGNTNNASLDRVTSVSNGGWGFNVFGANGNKIVFNNTSGSNNTLGNYQVATATNTFLGAHSQTSGTGIGATFLSGGSNNRGDIYSESGDEATAVAFAAGASNNNLSLTSQTAFTNSGTNNTIIINRQLEAAGAVGSPSYSFINSPTTGFYDGGGGAVVFSSVGSAIELFSSTTHRLGSGKCIGWSSNADPTAAGNDAGLCRENPGVIDFGNGSASDTTAKLKAAGYISAGTKFTSNAGCTEGTLLGGATAGKFTVGQNTACTIIITMGNTATAPTGWTCTAYDQTAVPAVAIRQTASTTTTCSLLMTVATNDVITFSAIGF